MQRRWDFRFMKLQVDVAEFFFPKMLTDFRWDATHHYPWSIYPMGSFPSGPPTSDPLESPWGVKKWILAAMFWSSRRHGKLLLLPLGWERVMQGNWEEVWRSDFWEIELVGRNVAKDTGTRIELEQARKRKRDGNLLQNGIRFDGWLLDEAPCKRRFLMMVWLFLVKSLYQRRSNGSPFDSRWFSLSLTLYPGIPGC